LSTNQRNKSKQIFREHRHGKVPKISRGDRVVARVALSLQLKKRTFYEQRAQRYEQRQQEIHHQIILTLIDSFALMVLPFIILLNKLVPLIVLQSG
jgi:hypothetical protein